MTGEEGMDVGGVEVPGSSSSLTQKDSMQIRSILIEANEQKMIGNKDRALKIFKKAFKVDSALPSVHYEIARILREKKQRSKALEHAKMAVALDPDHEWYRKFLAETYVEYGSYEKAADVYRELRDEMGRDLELSYRYADALIRAGKHEKAIGVYDSLEEQSGLRPRLSLQKQRLYQRMGNFEEALEEMKALVEKYPDEARYYGIMAELYQKMGNGDKALRSYERILEKDPSNGKAHLSLSRFYQKEGKEEKASEHLKEAFKSSSLGIDRKVKVLLNYYSNPSNDPEAKEKAFDLLDILLEAHPQEAKAYTIYGDFLEREGKEAKARSMFKKAVELDPDRFPIWRKILAIDQEMGDTDSLLVDSRKAKEYFPNQPAVHLFEGIALMQQERYEAAIDPLSYGRSLVVDNEELKYRFLERLGEANHRTGNHEASDRAYDKALEIHPEDPFLLNNYAYYLSTRKDSLSKAERMSKKAVSKEPGRPSFLDTYAWILYQQEAYQKAREKLKEAIERGGGRSATILEHYGDALYRTGEKEKALEYWKKARRAGGSSEKLERKIREEELPTP